jgi:hypothetical protein
MRPRIPRAPAEEDGRIALPWPNLDLARGPAYAPVMSDAPDQTEPVEPEPDDEPDDEEVPA